MASVQIKDLTEDTAPGLDDVVMTQKAAGASRKVKLRKLFKHLIGDGATPTHNEYGGSGTSPTVVLAGSDTAGLLDLTTGTGCSGSQPLLDITFDSAFETAPYVCLTPANAAAAALSGGQAVWLETSTGYIRINGGSTPLADSTQYKWFWHVIQ